MCYFRAVCSRCEWHGYCCRHLLFVDVALFGLGNATESDFSMGLCRYVPSRMFKNKLKNHRPGTQMHFSLQPTGRLPLLQTSSRDPTTKSYVFCTCGTQARTVESKQESDAASRLKQITNVTKTHAEKGCLQGPKKDHKVLLKGAQNEAKTCFGTLGTTLPPSGRRMEM